MNTQPKPGSSWRDPISFQEEQAVGGARYIVRGIPVSITGDDPFAYRDYFLVVRKYGGQLMFEPSKALRQLPLADQQVISATFTIWITARQVRREHQGFIGLKDQAQRDLDK